MDTNTVTSYNNNPDAPITKNEVTKTTGKPITEKARISEDQAAKARKFFANLKPAKKKEKAKKKGLSNQDFVRSSYNEILGAMGMGYNFVEIAEMLTGQSIKIPPATLKNYMSRVKAERKALSEKALENAPADTA